MSILPTAVALERHRFPADGPPGLFHLERHTITTGSVYYHYHPQFELSLVECARGTRIVGDDTQEFRVRDLVLIGPDTPHRWELGKTGGAESLPAEFWVVAFSSQTIGLELLESGEMATVRQLLGRARYGLTFSPETTLVGGRVIKAIAESEGLERLAGFVELLRVLSSDAGATPISGRNRGSENRESEYRIIRRILEHFLGDVSEHPTLAAAAEMAAMSVPSFTRLFRRVTGHSFIAYINNLRIVRACTLLEETALPIVEISLACGFSNLSHFNRMFLMQVGIQPRRYRQRFTPRDDS